MNSFTGYSVARSQLSFDEATAGPRELTPVIEIENLSIHSANECIVSGLSLTLTTGNPVTILGETGSGKSLLAQSIMGALPAGLTCSGHIRRFGRDDHTPDELEQLWGGHIAMLPQEPWLSLDPIMAGKRQVALVEQLVNGLSEKESANITLKRMTELGLGTDGEKVPDQLSGGMAQRLAYLCATAAGADVLIADEPTKGLDASHKSRVIDLLKKQSDKGSLLTITHDIDVARAIGGDLIVMRQGACVEQGKAHDILQNPASAYGKALIAAHSPEFPAVTTKVSYDKSPLVTFRQASKTRGGKSLFSNLDLAIAEGEIIGLSGDSGAGKSTLADMILGLVKTDEGTVWHSPELTRGKMLKLYQDPPSAFPRSITLSQNLNDLCSLHSLNKAEIPQWLDRLRLDKELLERRPSQVSGGELQRFALLRALMMRPKLLVADEPVSRLDPIVASETLSLLLKHTRRIGCALILISHDKVALNKICGRIIKLGGD
ncbi:ABC transporter ATP-binding protein [Endozoicomonas lisbonensis]|uniref:Peptide/nickel transport system ATP-binding protein n=1 Tax=Endozoicomonas lisbonensis TaxID=3120522 RepID=A0ABV2SB68_9GAMM